MPPGYGLEAAEPAPLDWPVERARLATARSYWIGTTTPGGRPHAMPVWGVVEGDRVCFGTDRGSRKARNLAACPAVVVHLPSGDDTLIVEGTAGEVTDPTRLRVLDDAYRTKYGLGFFENPGDVVVYAVTPRVAFGWQERDFVRTATRWRFAPSSPEAETGVGEESP